MQRRKGAGNTLYRAAQAVRMGGGEPRTNPRNAHPCVLRMTKPCAGAGLILYARAAALARPRRRPTRTRCPCAPPGRAPPVPHRRRRGRAAGRSPLVQLGERQPLLLQPGPLQRVGGHLAQGLLRKARREERGGLRRRLRGLGARGKGVEGGREGRVRGGARHEQMWFDRPPEMG